jgi:hypothetical protein
VVGTNCTVDDDWWTGLDRYYVGLAKMPSFFHGPCAADPKAHLEVFATPSRGKKIAELRWSGHGSCDVLAYRSNETCPRGLVPLEKVTSEDMAFIVVEHAGRWARIRLEKGTGWIHLAKADEVVEYEDLVYGEASNTTPAWDGRLCTVPGGQARRVDPSGEFGHGRFVNVLDSRHVRGTLWFRLEIYEGNPHDTHDPKVVAAGWIRGYSADRQPTLTFNPNGC